jgi:hypothetical protein
MIWRITWCVRPWVLIMGPMRVPIAGAACKAAKGATPWGRRVLASAVPSPATWGMSYNDLVSENEITDRRTSFCFARYAVTPVFLISSMLFNLPILAFSCRASTRSKLARIWLTFPMSCTSHLGGAAPIMRLFVKTTSWWYRSAEPISLSVAAPGDWVSVIHQLRLQD